MFCIRIIFFLEWVSPKPDPVVEATVCNWLSGHLPELDVFIVFGGTEWLPGLVFVESVGAELFPEPVASVPIGIEWPVTEFWVRVLGKSVPIGGWSGGLYSALQRLKFFRNLIFHPDSDDSNMFSNCSSANVKKSSSLYPPSVH